MIAAVAKQSFLKLRVHTENHSLLTMLSIRPCNACGQQTSIDTNAWEGVSHQQHSAAAVTNTIYDA